MSGLPAALEPWAEPLSLFPRELALSLGPWLQRLSLGLGPSKARTRDGLAEPDGYDGLARRGPYERLLASEWLLATELPEEFTRRAAMREHAFLRLAYEETAGTRRSVVLFDAGPSQLGTPRLAHLAALIVLWQRAQAAGATFAWGFLQHRDVPLLQAVTPVSVRRLLHARTAHEARAEDAEAWREALGPKAPDDVWLVGPERLDRLAQALPASRLVVRDVLEPGARKLSVSIRRARAAEVPLQLDLPAPDHCVRLLRDPFAAVTAPTQVLDTSEPRQILYSTKGKRLLVVLADGGVVAYPIPNSPSTAMGRPKHFRPPGGHRVVASGWHSRQLTLTWYDGLGLFIHGARERGELIPGSLERFKPPSPDAPVSACHVRPDGLGHRLLFLDGAGTLFSLSLGALDGLTVVDQDVTAFLMTFLGLSYLRGTGKYRPGVRMWDAYELVLDSGGEVRRFDLGLPAQMELGPGMAVTREDHERGRLVGPERVSELPLPKRDRVVAALSGYRWGEDCALTLDFD
ncbi:MAG TPA: hypothetical protein VK420_20510, partial [Longimicrobium sp.]|nr:hypothetical protein [Longimicrobium sp.]